MHNIEFPQEFLDGLIRRRGRFRLPSAKPGSRHGAERVYVEMFEWRDVSAIDLDYQLPTVMAVCEPMGAICEEMEFPEFEAIDLRPPKE